MSTLAGPYTVGDELPSLAVTWKDSDGNLIDFSGSFTWRLRLALNNVTVLEKTTGITGAATDPNVTIDWAVGELDNLSGGNSYAAQLRARRTSDSKDRTLSFTIKTAREIGAVPS